MSDKAHHPKHQHHFIELEQQYDASQLGMWAFLLTEILFFGGLFITYAIYRGMYPDAWTAASNQLDVMMGAINTAVLITSSLTMVFAVHSAKHGKNKATINWLFATLVFGIAFLVIKYFEYSAKYEHGLIPGIAWHPHGLAEPGIQLFFSLYFAMTGLHAFHMVIGMVYLVILMVQARNKNFDAAWNTPVDMVGLYWHFVDIVWIFLFPLLYLVARV